MTGTASSYSATAKTCQASLGCRRIALTSSRYTMCPWRRTSGWADDYQVQADGGLIQGIVQTYGASSLAPHDFRSGTGHPTEDWGLDRQASCTPYVGEATYAVPTGRARTHPLAPRARAFVCGRRAPAPRSDVTIE